MGKFEDHAKVAAWTAAEIGVATAAAVAASHWFSGEKFFDKDYDPVNKFHHKFFGGLKFVGACGLSTMVDNPWAKIALIGVGVQGLSEQMQISLGPDRVQKIGGKEDDLNKKLEELAKEYQKNIGAQNFSNVSGNNSFSGVSGGNESYSGVSGWGGSGWNAAA